MAEDVVPGSGAAEEDRDERREQLRGAASQPSPEARQPSAGPFTVYKMGQGLHVRWGTALGAGVIGLAGAGFVREYMRLIVGDDLVFRTLVPAAILVAVAWLIFWLCGQRRSSVDFMIATEGEMKKVNWASRREVLGATRVVIFTVFVLSIILAVVDFVFMALFSGIGVLKIPLWQSLLRGGIAPE